MCTLPYKSYLILISEYIKDSDGILKLINSVCKDIKEVDKQSIYLNVIFAEHEIDIEKYKNMLEENKKRELVTITIVINPSILDTKMYLIHDTIITLNKEQEDSILYFNKDKNIHCIFDSDTFPDIKI